MIVSGRRPPRSGGVEQALFRVLDSPCFQLGGMGIIAGMLVFAPVSSVFFFRLGLTFGIGIAAWICLHRSRDRRLLAGGALAVAAAWGTVWMVRPDTAGSLAVAGWLFFLGASCFRRMPPLNSAGTGRACFLDAALGGAMLILGLILLVKNGSLDYLAMTYSCAIGIVAATIGSCAIGNPAETYEKRRAK